MKTRPLAFTDLRSKFSTTKFAKTRALPKAFTEKGLYMIATILKSKQATEATFAIIETFSKIRHLSRNIQELSIVHDKDDQKALMQRSGEMIAELLDDDLQTTDTETSIELNFAVLKFKHTIKKKNKWETHKIMGPLGCSAFLLGGPDFFVNCSFRFTKKENASASLASSRFILGILPGWEIFWTLYCKPFCNK